MTGKISELRLDVQEARSFLASATRQRIKDLLSSEITKLENEMKTLEASMEQEKPKQEAPPQANKSCITTTIRNYSWDQSDKFMKLYITLTGVQNLDKQLITCNFLSSGLNFKANDLQGRNHELNISQFAHQINPEKSHFKVKNDMVVIFAAKETPGSWEAVLAEERKAIEAKKIKTNKAETDDPTGSIMGLMKQMYEDGDDEMKRMLNKTWYENQMKTGKPGDMGGLGDMDNLKL